MFRVKKIGGLNDGCSQWWFYELSVLTRVGPMWRKRSLLCFSWTKHIFSAFLPFPGRCSVCTAGFFGYIYRVWTEGHLRWWMTLQCLKYVCLGLETQSLHILPVFFTCLRHCLFSFLCCSSRDSVGTSGSMTLAEETAAAPLLEASFENLLLSSDVLSEIITAFRVQKITDQQLIYVHGRYSSRAEVNL